MLSCECPEYDGGYHSWYYSLPDDFIKLETRRRKRCCSCQNLIDIGSDCLQFARGRNSRTDIEENIYGDEVPLAPWYMCQWCGEMFLTFEEHGFCPSIGDNMFENLQDYWDINGYVPEKYRKEKQ